MQTIADVEKLLKRVTSLLAELNNAITRGTRDDIRPALVRAYEYYIDEFDANFRDFAQAPSDSYERMAYDQMEAMKRKRVTINQSERTDEELRADANSMLNALKSGKKAIEHQLRALQPAGGRRRKTYRRRGRRQTRKPKRSLSKHM